MDTSFVNVWVILIFLIILLACAYPYWRRQAILKRWSNSLSLNQHLLYFQTLFSDIDGFNLSRQSRVPYNAIEYTYGEIDFIPFIALLTLTKTNSNTVFYDLGSGIGKAIFAAAMVFHVKKACGIEILRPLHEAALQQQQRLGQFSQYAEIAHNIHWINADFLTTDITDATVVFINATAFFGERWILVCHYLKQLKPGAYIISTSKQLFDAQLLLIKKTPIQMSWGVVNAYIHQKIASNNLC